MQRHEFRPSYLLCGVILLAGCQTTTETAPAPGYLPPPTQYIPPTGTSPAEAQPTNAPGVQQAAYAVQPATVPAGSYSIPAQFPAPNALIQPTPTYAVAPTKPTRPNLKDPYVAELVDLMSETKSVDTFLVTLNLIAESNAEVRPAIPAIIRNAERLGIYGKNLSDTDSKAGELAKDVSEIIFEMSKAKASTEAKKSAKTGVTGVSMSQTFHGLVPTERMGEREKDAMPKAEPISKSPAATERVEEKP